MQLVYGKFDPDVTAPSFADWPKALTAVEIELFQYYSWKPKTTTYFHSWVKQNGIRIVPRISIRPLRSIEEYQDAIAVWMELFGEETIYFSVNSGRKEWNKEQSLKEIQKLPTTQKYFFEWGKSDSINAVKFISSLACFQGWIIDPDWHRSSLSCLNDTLLNYKLHGWNEERWIRRYGESRSQRILRALKKRAGSFLTLSYSGKIAEAHLFHPIKT